MASEPPPESDSIIQKVNSIRDFLSGKKTVSIDETTQNIKFLINHTKKFYIYSFVSDYLRHVLFLITCDDPDIDKTAYLKAANVLFKTFADLIPQMKPATNITELLNSINSITPYDYEARVMKYCWQQQYSFEEAVFFSDAHLRTFIDKFLDDLKPDKLYFQFSDFSENCAKYFQEQYGIPEDQPQTAAFSSRALYKMFLENQPLFPYRPTDEKFLHQIAYLRTISPKAISIREKFLPKDTTEESVQKQVKILYPHTVSIANYLPFLDLPDDLFYYISYMHDTLSEELVDIMYLKSGKKVTRAQFRGEVEIGQEDIMPIIILILVLADIPNLPDIVDFFNEYTTQIQVNSKSGLYMANIATAYGAIMNWEIPGEQKEGEQQTTSPEQKQQQEE